MLNIAMPLTESCYESGRLFLSKWMLKIPCGGNCTTRFPGYSVPLLFWGNTYSSVVVFLKIPSCSLSFCHVIQLFLLSSAHLIPCVQLPQGSFKSSPVNEFCRACVCTGQLSDWFFFSFMWVNMYVHSVSYSVNTLKRWLGICIFVWISVDENVLLQTSVRGSLGRILCQWNKLLLCGIYDRSSDFKYF